MTINYQDVTRGRADDLRRKEAANNNTERIIFAAVIAGAVIAAAVAVWCLAVQVEFATAIIGR